MTHNCYKAGQIALKSFLLLQTIYTYEIWISISNKHTNLHITDFSSQTCLPEKLLLAVFCYKTYSKNWLILSSCCWNSLSKLFVENWHTKYMKVLLTMIGLIASHTLSDFYPVCILTPTKLKQMCWVPVVPLQNILEY